MSSFICSKYHFQKVRDNTIYFLNADKYKRYTIGLDYDTNDDEILKFVNHNIYSLVKNNFASFNQQYNENNIITDDYKEIFKKEPIKRGYYKNNIHFLIGLYNAYSCINYQIEIDYNKEFINNIMFAISSAIVEYLNEYKSSYGISENVNQWQYTEEIPKF